MEQPFEGRTWTPRSAFDRPPRPRTAAGWLWPVLGLVAVAGAVGVLVWRGVIPAERLRNLIPGSQLKPVEVATPPVRPPAVATPPVHPRSLRLDTLLALDLPRPAARRSPRRMWALDPPWLPPGALLSGTVYVVLGPAVESLEEIAAQHRLGIRVVQVLDSGERVVLEEFPADPAAAEEFSATTLPGDTLVARMSLRGVDVTLKGVIPDALAADLLQHLTLVRW